MKAIIIVGSKGFLGKNLYNKIRKSKQYSNYKIFAFSKKNLNLLKNKSIENKFNKIKEKYNVTAIFHCAVLYKSADWVNKNQADVSYNNNIINLNILKNSQLFFPKSLFVCMLSYALYNKNKSEKKILSDYQDNKFTNSYSDSKYNLLKYCVYYEKQFNYKSICLVISNLYGNENITSENNHFVSSIIEKIIQAKLKKKKKIKFYGNFLQLRDFLHIDDAVNAIIKLSQLKSTKGCNVINLGYGKSYKMEQILHKVANLVNFEGELEINNNGVANHKSISIVKIKKIINWKPNIKIYEGLKRVVEWSLKKKR
ncbi:NAD(P)-dependent oxidoreductase [Pelagibacteraceae bacterium]|nr:NAD(P)-dependent oxidoreductase [Pelagibacteraceae bacterium]